MTLAVEIMDDSTDKQPAEDAVQKLCNEGGLLVAFETIGTLYQCVYAEQNTVFDEALSTLLQWEVVGYGVPVMMANKNGVALCLADVESGDKLCSFTISEASQYTVIVDDFHIFTKPSGCFGIAFSDSIVAGKVFEALKRTVPCTRLAAAEDEEVEEDEGIEPSPKRKHIDEGDNESVEEVDQGEDDVDGTIRKKKKKHLEISEPQDFQHLSHIGDDASIFQLTKVLSWTDTLRRKERIVNQVISIPSFARGERESNTELSTSFEEGKIPPPPTAAPAPPPPPPPAVVPPPAKLVLKKKKDSSMASNDSNKDLAASLADEIKRGVVLRPVNSDRTSCGSQSSGKSFSSLQEELKEGVVLKSVKNNRTMMLPKPPTMKQTDQLMFEIKTFRRNKLRDISMTDFPCTRAPPPEDENSLEVILKRSLAAMFRKVSDATDITNVGTVNSKGEDTFDGVLF